MPSSGKKPVFETNGLYILVSEMGDVEAFHWGFYLALSPTNGTIIHLVNNTDTNWEWKFRARQRQRGSFSQAACGNENWSHAPYPACCPGSTTRRYPYRPTHNVSSMDEYG